MTGTNHPDDSQPTPDQGLTPEEGPDGLDPAEQAEISALLASARVDEPMPDDVAARLDDTLAGLRREPGREFGREPQPTVVPLHRRWAPRMLAAAAAVVVLGGAAVGVQQVLDRSGDSSGEAATTLEEPAPEGASADPGSGSKSGVDAGRAEQGPAKAAAPLAVVRPDHLREDAARVAASTEERDGSFGLAPEAGEPESTNGSESSSVPPAPACPGPATARALPGAATVQVRYGDQVAALLLRPVTQADPGHRVVEVWTCTGDERLARTVVPLQR